MTEEEKHNLATLITELMKENRRDEVKPLYEKFMSDIDEEESAIIETTTYLQDLKARIEGKVNESIIPTGFKDIDDRIFGAVK